MVGNDQSFKLLLEGALAGWSDCDALYFDALPQESVLASYLHAPMKRIDGTYIYSPFGMRPRHMVQLGVSFDDYLGQMTSKARYNLRRDVTQLQREGSLELFCCQDVSHVQAFLSGAMTVSDQTWQHRLLGSRLKDDPQTVKRFEELARGGLLRCYLLRSNGQPIAFVIGYQYQGIYQYSEIGYDHNLSSFSPGKVLLYQLLDDLHRDGSFDRLNFGVGDASYKRRFGTHEDLDESLLMIKKQFRNRLVTSSHGAFISGLEMVKRLVGRRVQK